MRISLRRRNGAFIVFPSLSVHVHEYREACAALEPARAGIEDRFVPVQAGLNGARF
jgi:hypothetical protein